MRPAYRVGYVGGLLGVGLLFLWVGGLLSSGRAFSGEGENPYLLRGESKGMYMVKLPVGTRSWQLPEPGDGHNSCERGDVRTVHWAPNGRTLVAEVVGRQHSTLCLYDLRAADFKDGSVGQKVQVMRLSILPPKARGASGWKARQADQRPGESDPAFRPGKEQGAGRVGYSSEVGLVHTEAERGTRVFGISLANGLPDLFQPVVRPLDGLAEGLRPAGFFMQPQFFPLEQGGLAGGMVLVTDQGEGSEVQSCGRGRLVFLREPERAGGGMVGVTVPCEGGRATVPAPGDRYPAWNPAVLEGQLAFVRIQAGLGGALCLQGVGKPGGARCDLAMAGRERHARIHPAFTGDGRFLVVWAHYFPESDRLNAVYQLEVVALESGGVLKPGVKAGVALGAVRKDPVQAPALVRDEAGQWRVVVVGPGRDDLDGILEDLVLGGAGPARRYGTDLRNVKGVAGGGRDGVPFLALVAQGYRADRVSGAEVDGAKVFIRRGLE